MKIREIRGYHVECALPEPVRNSISLFTSRSALLIELVTDSGLSGWGETQNPVAAWSYLETSLAPLLRDRDPMEGGALWRLMIGQHGKGEIAMLAASAIDMALWDLKGRALAQPISTLLGGRLRDRITAYASGPFMKPGAQPYGDFGRQVDGYLEAGFAAVKARCGASPRTDAEAMSGLRKRLGPDLLLMADFNRGYSLPSALEAGRLLREAGLLWMEEPIAMDDLAGYQAIRTRTGIPVAGGEGFSSLSQYRSALATGAFDIVQPDLYLCGGFTGAQRIAGLAEAYETPYVPHVWGTFVNFHASLQLAATLKAYRIRDGMEFPLFEYEQGPLILLQGTPELEPDGTLGIPEAPGIGIEVRPETFASHIRKTYRIAL